MPVKINSVAVIASAAVLTLQWRAPAQDDQLARQAQAILAESCYGCHGPGQQLANLRLDTGVAGVVTPGASAASLLIKRVTGTEGLDRMPLGAPALSTDKIATLAKWIDAGAVLPAARRHWAFVPPIRPAVPTTSRNAWLRNPIDAFVLSRLDRESLTPSPEADRATLLRRASLDLTGLPPTPAELDAFLADRSPNAYEKQVDRLLASPHYGERWARIWLDAARYADSNGYEKDAPRFVWFYRD
jgi:mono/diheme cytochrome c family protein